MGKPLSRPGCFRQSPCCSEKGGAIEVGDGYGDGYVPQRSIYDTMCINEQIDHGSSHSTLGSRGGQEGDLSRNGSLGRCTGAGLGLPDMFDPPRCTSASSMVRRLDERVIYDSLKLGQEFQGSLRSPGGFGRAVSPSVSSISAPGGSGSTSSGKRHHHHPHHQHQDGSRKEKDQLGRHSWKVLTPPRHLECLELSAGDMMERSFLIPGSQGGGMSLYPHSSSMTSPLISPFSGSPLSSGYHTPVFFSPAKHRPSQTQSLKMSPPPLQPRLPSQTQSLKLSPPSHHRHSPNSPHSPYRHQHSPHRPPHSPHRIPHSPQRRPHSSYGHPHSPHPSYPPPHSPHPSYPPPISPHPPYPPPLSPHPAYPPPLSPHPSFSRSHSPQPPHSPHHPYHPAQPLTQLSVKNLHRDVKESRERERLRSEERERLEMERERVEMERERLERERAEREREQRELWRAEREREDRARLRAEKEREEREREREKEREREERWREEKEREEKEKMEREREEKERTERERKEKEKLEREREERERTERERKEKERKESEKKKKESVKEEKAKRDKQEIEKGKTDKEKHPSSEVQGEVEPVRTKPLGSAKGPDSVFPEPDQDKTPYHHRQIPPGPGPGNGPVAGPGMSSQGMESTWPRRLIVRKRTVRQGGAVHNLPILPPLPSVLAQAALERKNLPRLTPFPEHQTCMVGLLGRSSLKEQSLEQWRVFRELEEPKKLSAKADKKEDKGRGAGGKTRVGGSEKIGKKSRVTESNKKEVVKGKEAVKKDEKGVMDKKDGGGVEKNEKVVKEKDDGGRVEKDENGVMGKEDGGGVEVKEDETVRIPEEKEKMEEKKGEAEEENGTVVDEGGAEKAVVKEGKGVEEVMVEKSEGEPAQEVEGWDAVLDMVNTLWDEGWGGDSDSCTGSLKNWPLLRPPSGFGGSHPPSSAASELSLQELERRAKEVEVELASVDHLDLSHCQPDPLRAQTAGQLRDKPGMRPDPGDQSRSQPSLDLFPLGSSSDTQAWSGGKEEKELKEEKEDGSPDSNLTLESDSSGVFMSLSNPSHTSQEEDGGSDSDRPNTESDLGSSTSLDQDKEELSVFKEWGREESSELQWCYPSLLKASSTCEAGKEGEVEGVEKGTEGSGMEEQGKESKPLDSAKGKEKTTTRKGATTAKGSVKLVTHSTAVLSGSDSARPLSPNKPALRRSGLDSSDIDPFVATDSFVYLAVSARPVSQAEVTPTSEVSPAPPPSSLLKPGPHLDGGDFLSTDSFVYLAGPQCQQMVSEGHSPYSGSKDSDSDSTGSGVGFAQGSAAGDSDWDSDASDSAPARSKPKTEPCWEMWAELEQDVLSELFQESDEKGVESVADASQGELTRKVTWQFKPSVQSGSKKDKEVTSQCCQEEAGEMYTD